MRFKSRTSRFLLNLIAILTATPMFIGVAVSAQTPPIDYGLKETACKAGLPCGNVSAPEIATAIVNIVVSIVGVLAVIMLVYGGAMWLTSAGNEEKIKKARGLILNAVIGLAIILMAFTISSFVLRSLTKATQGTASESAAPIDCPGICSFSVDDPAACVAVPEGDESCADWNGGGSKCYKDNPPQTCTST